MHNHEQDERFTFVMAALAEAYGQECSDFKVKIYAKALSDIPIDDLERACWNVINSRPTATFPKVAEIRESIHGKTDDLAVMALDKLEKAMGHVGKYRSVKFDDLIVHAVVSSMGGWSKLCSLEAEEWKWGRKDFERTYKAFASRPLSSLQIPEHLPGIEEISNSANGYDREPEIKLIGNHMPEVQGLIA